MCLIVIPSNTLTKLVAAAQAVQSLVDDETLSKAYVLSDEEAQTQSIAAFDRLAECAAFALAEHKDVSPFIRYRKEVLDETNHTAKGLRSLVLNMYHSHTGICLFDYFMNADPLYTRIAMDMIASFIQRGDNDHAFHVIAGEIFERFYHEVDVS